MVVRSASCSMSQDPQPPKRTVFQNLTPEQQPASADAPSWCRSFPFLVPYLTGPHSLACRALNTFACRASHLFVRRTPSPACLGKVLPACTWSMLPVCTQSVCPAGGRSMLPACTRISHLHACSAQSMLPVCMSAHRPCCPFTRTQNLPLVCTSSACCLCTHAGRACRPLARTRAEPTARLRTLSRRTSWTRCWTGRPPSCPEFQRRRTAPRS